YPARPPKTQGTHPKPATNTQHRTTVDSRQRARQGFHDERRRAIGASHQTAESNMTEQSGPSMPAHTVPTLVPADEHNRTLLHNVHPPDWRNPEPEPRYNLVVIGAGTAGLVTAAGAAGLGARVALIERYLLGGDCLNVGCVPSKCVIRSSRVVGDVHDAARLGVPLRSRAEPEFSAVMERMRRLRARISHHDSAERFQHELGVDVFLGDARFAGPDTVAVAGQALRFKRAVIATGARASHPPIP